MWEECGLAYLSKVDSNTPYLKLVQMHEEYNKERNKRNHNGKSYDGQETTGKEEEWREEISGIARNDVRCGRLGNLSER